jgi:hypothetical protein
MGHFLRDQHTRNHSITLKRIEELYGVFEQYLERLNALGVSDTTFHCVIRFDGKGNRVFSLADLQRSYRQARQVERVVLTLETGRSMQTGRVSGTYMEVKLDSFDQNAGLIVSADDQAWVDGAFAAVTETLTKSRAWYGFIRTPLAELLIQISGVAFVFLFSFATAKKLTPHVATDNPQLYAFILVFLVLANVWTYLQRTIHFYISRIFPNVQFVMEGREYLHWLLQGAVTTVLGGAIMYSLAGATSVLSGTVGAFLK